MTKITQNNTQDTSPSIILASNPQPLFTQVGLRGDGRVSWAGCSSENRQLKPAYSIYIYTHVYFI